MFGREFHGAMTMMLSRYTVDEEMKIQIDGERNKNNDNEGSTSMVGYFTPSPMAVFVLGEGFRLGDTMVGGRWSSLWWEIGQKQRK